MSLMSRAYGFIAKAQFEQRKFEESLESIRNAMAIYVPTAYLCQKAYTHFKGAGFGEGVLEFDLGCTLEELDQYASAVAAFNSSLKVVRALHTSLPLHPS